MSIVLRVADLVEPPQLETTQFKAHCAGRPLNTATKVGRLGGRFMLLAGHRFTSLSAEQWGCTAAQALQLRSSGGLTPKTVVLRGSTRAAQSRFCGEHGTLGLSPATTPRYAAQAWKSRVVTAWVTRLRAVRLRSGPLMVLAGRLQPFAAWAAASHRWGPGNVLLVTLRIGSMLPISSW